MPAEGRRELGGGRGQINVGDGKQTGAGLSHAHQAPLHAISGYAPVHQNLNILAEGNMTKTKENKLKRTVNPHLICCIIRNVYNVVINKRLSYCRGTTHRRHIILEVKELNYLQLDNVKYTVWRHSLLKSTTTLKPGLGVTQGVKVIGYLQHAYSLAFHIWTENCIIVHHFVEIIQCHRETDVHSHGHTKYCT